MSKVKVSDSVSEWQGHLLSCCGQLKKWCIYILRSDIWDLRSDLKLNDNWRQLDCRTTLRVESWVSCFIPHRKFSENLKIFRKSENFPKILKWLGHVSLSLWSHVSRVTSLSVLFGSVFQQWQWLSDSVTQWVSQWVTREPIELSGDS